QNHWQIKARPAAAAKPLKAAEGDYFSSPAPSGGRLFRFPDGQIMGQFVYGKSERLTAKGCMVGPRDPATQFLPSEPFVKDPELFARFAPDDIRHLDCGQRTTLFWSGKHLDCITRSLTGLVSIDLSQADIDSTAIVQLNRLKNLKSL